MDKRIEVKQIETRKSSPDFALADSCVRLREVEHMLFRSDSQSAPGLFVGELRLLLTRIAIGISIDRSATFSLLIAAGKVADRTEADRG